MQKKLIAMTLGIAVALTAGCNREKKATSNQPDQPTATTVPVAPVVPGKGTLGQAAAPVQSATNPAAAAAQTAQKTGEMAAPNPANPAPATGTKPAAPTSKTVAPPELGVSKPTASLGVPTTQKKPLSASKMAFFTTQNFLVTMASNTNSEPKLFEKAYENRWLVFQKDQTFQVFKDAVPTNTGRWAYDEDADILFLRTDNAYFNNSWKCQSFKKNLLLLGNTELNNTGIQIRLFMTEKKPGDVKSDGSN